MGELRPLDYLSQQPLKGPSGERLVLHSDDTRHPSLPNDKWFSNIAKKNAAEFLRDINSSLFHQSPGFIGYDESWRWSAVVMNPPLPVPEPLMLLLVAYLAWSLELD